MSRAPGLQSGVDGRDRCWWAGQTEIYRRYHDEEWGRPVDDDVRLFEKLCLEGFQSGLSWLTILKKREGFRRAFAGFDHHRIARWRPGRVDALLQNADIVRHRKKIESVLNNARRAVELEREQGSLAAYFWSFEPPRSERPRRMTRNALMKLTQTETSNRLSKDLKKRGFSFVGPTTAYAFMQAMGLVNDHLEGCCARDDVEELRADFHRPG
jgi:DNA-3-methyladenine glycosylase I